MKLSEMTAEEYEAMIRKDWCDMLFGNSFEELWEHAADPNYEYKDNQVTIDLAEKYFKLGDYYEADTFLDSIDQWIRATDDEPNLTDLQVKKIAGLRKGIAEAQIWKLLVQADNYLKEARTTNPDKLLDAHLVYEDAEKLAKKAGMYFPNQLHAPTKQNSEFMKSLTGNYYEGLREELFAETLRQLGELAKPQLKLIE